MFREENALFRIIWMQRHGWLERGDLLRPKRQKERESSWTVDKSMCDGTSGDRGKERDRNWVAAGSCVRRHAQDVVGGFACFVVLGASPQRVAQTFLTKDFSHHLT